MTAELPLNSFFFLDQFVFQGLKVRMNFGFMNIMVPYIHQKWRHLLCFLAKLVARLDVWTQSNQALVLCFDFKILHFLLLFSQKPCPLCRANPGHWLLSSPCFSLQHQHLAPHMLFSQSILKFLFQHVNSSM
ncbi:hypothetical protein V6N12_034923 [Hibiscus sabdariffa]|uniref:Uncharacterized protein n=1 Tax=Hibiscus sabdariffa TaxID=183260 RepID=A0ABR2BNV1_9ROSI